jgi:hypothetical protein
VRNTECPAKRLPNFGGLFIGLFWVKNVLSTWVENSTVPQLFPKSIPSILLPPTVLLEYFHVWCGLIDDQLNWATRSWGTFNSRLLPVFPAGRAATSFGRRSSPSQIEPVAAIRLLPLLLEDVPLQARLNLWLQYDWTPPHLGLQVTQYFNRCYGNRWIGCGGPLAWPPRSP